MTIRGLLDRALDRTANNPQVAKVAEVATDAADNAFLRFAERFGIRCPKALDDPSLMNTALQVFVAIMTIWWAYWPGSLGRVYVSSDLLGVIGVWMCGSASALLVIDYACNEESPRYEVPWLRRYQWAIFYGLALGWFLIGAAALDLTMTLVYSLVLSLFALRSAIHSATIERRRRQAAAVTGRRLDA